ncbi:MAG: hypothetical protein ACLQPV_04530 [Vulcanimicrobiaceae bacterium]
MKQTFVLALLAAGIAVAACSNSSSSTSAAGAPANGAAPNPAATNPTDFPLYNGATIVGTRNWTQPVDVSQVPGGAKMYPQGSGTYDGHQVVAGTTASMADLHQWLQELDAKPPQGYVVVASGSSMDQARAQAQRYGLDFDAFRKPGGANVVVVVLDPASMNQKIGPALGLIEKFRTLPDVMKGPIDQQVKQRIGMSASEALDPAAPVGAALSGFDQVKSSNGRAIVIIDATKQ